MPLTPQSRMYEEKLARTRKKYESRNAFASERSRKAVEKRAEFSSPPTKKWDDPRVSTNRTYSFNKGAGDFMAQAIIEPIKSTTQILNEGGNRVGLPENIVAKTIGSGTGKFVDFLQQSGKYHGDKNTPDYVRKLVEAKASGQVTPLDVVNTASIFSPLMGKGVSAIASNVAREGFPILTPFTSGGLGVMRVGGTKAAIKDAVKALDPGRAYQQTEEFGKKIAAADKLIQDYISTLPEEHKASYLLEDVNPEDIASVALGGDVDLASIFQRGRMDWLEGRGRSLAKGSRSYFVRHLPFDAKELVDRYNLVHKGSIERLAADMVKRGESVTSKVELPELDPVELAQEWIAQHSAHPTQPFEISDTRGNLGYINDFIGMTGKEIRQHMKEHDWLPVGGLDLDHLAALRGESDLPFKDKNALANLAWVTHIFNRSMGASDTMDWLMRGVSHIENESDKIAYLKSKLPYYMGKLLG